MEVDRPHCDKNTTSSRGNPVTTRTQGVQRDGGGELNIDADLKSCSQDAEIAATFRAVVDFESCSCLIKSTLWNLFSKTLSK